MRLVSQMRNNLDRVRAPGCRRSRSPYTRNQPASCKDARHVSLIRVCQPSPVSRRAASTSVSRQIFTGSCVAIGFPRADDGASRAARCPNHRDQVSLQKADGIPFDTAIRRASSTNTAARRKLRLRKSTHKIEIINNSMATHEKINCCAFCRFVIGPRARRPDGGCQSRPRAG